MGRLLSRPLEWSVYKAMRARAREEAVDWREGKDGNIVDRISGVLFAVESR